MSYIIRSGEGTRRDADSVQLENIVTVVNGMGASMARGEISGLHGPTLNTKCNRFYYFLSGQCSVTVGNFNTHVTVGDTVLVPKETTHALEGKAEYLVLNVPEFDPSTEVAQP